MHRLDCTKKTVSFSLYLMLPKPSDHCFLSKRHHKGLSHCKPPEISDHPFTSPPSPKEKKRGDPSSSPLEQASYCWVFGCSCMGFLSDGMSMSARETIFNRTAPRDQGVTWSSQSQDWTVVGMCHMWEVRQPSGTPAPLSYRMKRPLHGDKMSSWLQSLNLL